MLRAPPRFPMPQHAHPALRKRVDERVRRTADLAGHQATWDQPALAELLLRLQESAGNTAVQRFLEAAATSGKLGRGIPRPDEEMPPITGRDSPRSQYLSTAKRLEEADAMSAEEPAPRLRMVTVPGAARAAGKLAAVSGRLGLKSAAPPTEKTCGDFSWTVQWVLDKPSKKGGWIVQHVKTAFDLKDGAGKAVDMKPKKEGDLDPAWWPIWEAWQVNADQKVTTYAETGDLADDTYGLGEYPDTKGKIKITGTATFYEGLTLPSDFKVTDAAPAWILPVTKKKPKLKGGTGTIDHSLTATWDCTASSKDRKTKVKTSK